MGREWTARIIESNLLKRVVKDDLLAYIYSNKPNSEIHMATKILAAQSVKLSGELIALAKATAKAEERSVPKQIEYWAKIGRQALDNPDLPISFIRELNIAMNEEPIEVESIDTFFDSL